MDVIQECFEELLEELSDKNKKRLTIAGGVLGTTAIVGVGAKYGRKFYRGQRLKKVNIQRKENSRLRNLSKNHKGRQPGGYDDVLGRVDKEIPIKVTEVKPTVKNNKPEPRDRKNNHEGRRQRSIKRSKIDKRENRRNNYDDET